MKLEDNDLLVWNICQKLLRSCASHPYHRLGLHLLLSRMPAVYIDCSECGTVGTCVEHHKAAEHEFGLLLHEHETRPSWRLLWRM
jgi:hypothetical protein